MIELPGGRASAMTEATQQLPGAIVKDDRRSVPEPPTREAVESAMLGELAGQSLAPLTSAERRCVRRAVRRGRVVDDVRLAPAAIAVAVRAQHAALTPVQRITGRSAWSHLIGPFSLAVVFVLGGLDESLPIMLVFAALVLITSIGQIQALLPHRRRAALAARAEALNRAVLSTGFRPPDNRSAVPGAPTTLERPWPENPDAS